MDLCRTCKWWEKPDDQWDDITNPVDEDTYEPKEMLFEVRRCVHPSKTFCERPVERNGFGLADGSNYWAVLYTAEEFGCVRHEHEEPGTP